MQTPINHTSDEKDEESLRYDIENNQNSQIHSQWYLTWNHAHDNALLRWPFGIITSINPWHCSTLIPLRASISLPQTIHSTVSPNNELITVMVLISVCISHFREYIYTHNYKARLLLYAENAQPTRSLDHAIHYLNKVAARKRCAKILLRSDHKWIFIAFWIACHGQSGWFNLEAWRKGIIDNNRVGCKS